GDAVQRDRRLAGAGGAADDDEPRRRPRDQPELLGIDEARDVGKVLVCALPRPFGMRAETALRAFVRRMRAQRGAFAARETRQLAVDPPPAFCLRGIGDENALGRVDALQTAVADSERPARDDVAASIASRDLLLVRVALAVAVEDPGDRRV